MILQCSVGKTIAIIKADFGRQAYTMTCDSECQDELSRTKTRVEFLKFVTRFQTSTTFSIMIALRKRRLLARLELPVTESNRALCKPRPAILAILARMSPSNSKSGTSASTRQVRLRFRFLDQGPRYHQYF